MQYAGAYSPLVIIRKGEVIEFKADKSPIAISEREINFTNNEIHYQTGDAVYLFTDGFADQFGGPNGKKLMRKKMKDMLVRIQDLEMVNQGRFLSNALADWQGSYAQVDDILIIGFKL